MESYKWKNRPLLVFAGDEADRSLAEQRAIVEQNASGFRERDMAVIYVVGGNVSAIFGQAPPVQSANALRKRFNVSLASFRAILVGKDGGSKLSASSQLSANRMFSLIDSMPMRRNEMRRQ